MENQPPEKPNVHSLLSINVMFSLFMKLSIKFKISVLFGNVHLHARFWLSNTRSSSSFGLGFDIREQIHINPPLLKSD